MRTSSGLHHLSRYIVETVSIDAKLKLIVVGQKNLHQFQNWINYDLQQVGQEVSSSKQFWGGFGWISLGVSIDIYSSIE